MAPEAFGVAYQKSLGLALGSSQLRQGQNESVSESGLVEQCAGRECAFWILMVAAHPKPDASSRAYMQRSMLAPRIAARYQDMEVCCNADARGIAGVLAGQRSGVKCAMHARG